MVQVEHSVEQRPMVGFCGASAWKPVQWLSGHGVEAHY